MDEKRNSDNENNNTHQHSNNGKKGMQNPQNLSLPLENSENQQIISVPPPSQQTAGTKEVNNQLHGIIVKTINHQSKPLPQKWKQNFTSQHVARPATLVIMPKYIEDKENNNSVEIQSKTIENQHTAAASNQEYEQINSGKKYNTPYSVHSYTDKFTCNGENYNVTRDYENNFNNNNYNSLNGNNNGKNKANSINQSIDTLTTVNTYLVSSGAESIDTIGGALFDRRNQSFDLESNFSRILLGSQYVDSSSTLNTMQGRKQNETNFKNLATSIYVPRSHGTAHHIQNMNHILFEINKKQQLENKVALAKRLALYKQHQARLEKEKEKKKKRIGPPPQVRNQASRQMEDTMANRPRKYTSETNKREKKGEHTLQLTATYEKY